ncbi:hypothetical protein V8C35DRAFT_302555 [Trichoderma chlorosporum]
MLILLFSSLLSHINNMPGSPTQSTNISGTTTNVNTPYLDDESTTSGSQSDDQDSTSGDHFAAPQTPILSRQHEANIQPTWLSKVDERRIQARVCWDPSQKMNILLDIHWAEQHAFIKLYIRLRLNGTPSAYQYNRRNIYILIPPERIHQLLFTAKPIYIPFGASTTALTFYLNRPPTLIRPQSDLNFIQGAEEAMQSLKNLIQQTHFTIYAFLPARRLSHRWLQQFCEDITQHKFTAIPSLADWNTLYQGSNDKAEAIEGDSLPGHMINQNNPAIPGLPSYGEVEPTAPPLHFTKRKRSRDESSIVGQTVHDTVDQQVLAKDDLDAKLAAHEHRLKEINSACELRMHEMLSTHQRKLEEMLSAHERKIEEMFSARERRLEDIEDGLTSIISASIEEGLAEVHDSVVESITSMPLEATISFPSHPY